MAVKTSISLTEEQDAYARSMVASGRYASVSAVLQRGLEMLRRDADAHDAEIAALRGLIGQRLAEPSEPLEGVEELVAAAGRAD
jgi:antitoxin ParD1/3/4